MDYESRLHLKLFLLLVFGISLVSSTDSARQKDTDDAQETRHAGEPGTIKGAAEEDPATGKPVQTAKNNGTPEIDHEEERQLKESLEAIEAIEKEASAQVARGTLVLELTRTVKKLAAIRKLTPEKRKTQFSDLQVSWTEAKKIFHTCQPEAAPPQPKETKSLNFKGFLDTLNVFHKKSSPDALIKEGCSIESHKLAGDKDLQEMVKMIDDALRQHQVAEDKGATGGVKSGRRRKRNAVTRTLTNIFKPGWMTAGAGVTGVAFGGAGGGIVLGITGWALEKTIAATWFAVGQIGKYIFCTVPCFFGFKVCKTLKFRIPKFFRGLLGLNKALPEYQSEKERDNHSATPNQSAFAKGSARFGSIRNWRIFNRKQKRENVQVHGDDIMIDRYTDDDQSHREPPFGVGTSRNREGAREHEEVIPFPDYQTYTAPRDVRGQDESPRIFSTRRDREGVLEREQEDERYYTPTSSIAATSTGH